MRAVAEVSTGGVQTCLFSAAHSPAAVGPVGGKTEEQEQQKKKGCVGSLQRSLAALLQGREGVWVWK